jgi:hypothetical protein
MSDALITLKSFANESFAYIDHGLLASHGVESFVSKDDAGGAYPYLQPAMGVKLKIKHSDLKIAADILNIPLNSFNNKFFTTEKIVVLAITCGLAISIAILFIFFL